MIFKKIYETVEFLYDVYLYRFNFWDKSLNEDVYIPLDIKTSEAYLNIKNNPSENTLSKWEEMKSKIDENNKIYLFRSCPKSWRQLCGREGIALMNNKEIKAFIQTQMN
ncbi:hypothetical protein [Poseidonibacter antarcticus]|uniref:hypothetical protein n=1 Tax=Poseidonibacter antarcticus TaxID=2478538 RepID=UPI000EF4EA72|nr:hypothetical protein [Poseidonibacter antarcticus]